MGLFDQRGATDWEIDNEVQRQYEDLHGYNDDDEPITNVWMEWEADEEMNDKYILWDEGGVLVRKGFSSEEEVKTYAKSNGFTIIPKPDCFQ